MYPASIAQNVSKERLERFFDREDDSYQIKGALRDDAFLVANMGHLDAVVVDQFLTAVGDALRL